jgi:protein TonB
MTNFRYGFSFIISSLLYGALGYALLVFLDVPKKLREKPLERVIKISVIKPKKPKVITPPVIAPPKEIIKPKPKPKKIIKKVIKKSKPKPKHKKIVKKIKPKPKKTTHKKVVKKKIVKKTEPIIEEEYFTPKPVEVVEYNEPQVIEEAPTAPKPIKKPKVDKSAKKRAFLRRVRGQIKANKKYPKMALRRHIEGSVGVMFDIGANRDVSNIRFLNGRSILQKSVRKAIMRSFPLSIPYDIQSEFPMYNISVTINFRIN